MFQFCIKFLQSENCTLKVAYDWLYFICGNDKQNYQAGQKKIHYLGLCYVLNYQMNLNCPISNVKEMTLFCLKKIFDEVFLSNMHVNISCPKYLPSFCKNISSSLECTFFLYSQSIKNIMF